jgi:hypothetical protein
MPENSQPEKSSAPKPALASSNRAASSAYISFRDLEEQRQREWLFRRHRHKRPAWKRD